MGRQRKSKILTPKTLKKVFKQRKDGILKKAFELSTLCEVDVGVIIFGPYDASPSIWPKETEVLHNIVTRYQKTSNEERQKRATNMYTSCFRNIGSNGNNEKEDNLVTAEVPTYNLDNFSAEELMGLYSSIEEKIEAVNARISMMKNNGQILLTNYSMFEEVQSYGEGLGLDQNMMMMNQLLVMSNYYQCGYPVNDDQAKYLENQRLKLELMMMYNGDYRDVDVGDCTGLMLGDDFDGVMLSDDSSSLEWSFEDLLNQIPEQVQYGGDHSQFPGQGQGQVPFDIDFDFDYDDINFDLIGC